MIRYATEGIEMPVFDHRRVELWIRKTAAEYGFSVGEVRYIFCSDERILEVNRQFLGHDYYTDHIGFDYSTVHTLNGDIYLSLETIATNAQIYDNDNHDNKDISSLREFYRVLIHAILHLIGQTDKTPEDEAEMHHKEDQALEKLTSLQ